MYRINSDCSISLAQGDTMMFTITMTTGEEAEPAAFPEGTVAIFALSKPGVNNIRTSVPVASGLRTVRSVPTEYVTAFKKKFDVQGGDTVIIHLTNAETRNLETGEYRWDVRIVTDPEYDEQGDVKCDDNSDQVISLFSGGDPMPKFTITEVITIV